MTHMKRIAMPKIWPIEKKQKTFVVRPRGPYKFNESFPLLIIMRDMLKLGNTSKEIKKIVKESRVLINNRIIKDIKFNVGLFDKISIPSMNKYYEVTIKDKKIVLIETKKEETEKKICKLIGKKILNKNQMQLNLYGGINIIFKNKEKLNIGDSIILNLGKNSIEKVLPLEKGRNCLVVRGKNIGKSGKIVEIEEGKKKGVVFENKDGKIKVFKRNIWVIG